MLGACAQLHVLQLGSFLQSGLLQAWFVRGKMSTEILVLIWHDFDACKQCTWVSDCLRFFQFSSHSASASAGDSRSDQVCQSVVDQLKGSCKSVTNDCV